jgi:hypothetical protein
MIPKSQSLQKKIPWKRRKPLPHGQEVVPCGREFFFLMMFIVEFFDSQSSTYGKNDMAKRLGRFNVRKVPKTKKNT